MMGVQYMICHWAINRTDPQNLLSITLDVLLQLPVDLPNISANTDCFEA